jgi:hypothetical protein
MSPTPEDIKNDNHISGVGAAVLVDQEQKHDERKCEATIGNGHGASPTREEGARKEGRNPLEVDTDSDPPSRRNLGCM